MRFSEAKNHKVVSTTEASSVGKVRRFVLDESGRRVVGLHLKGTPGKGDLLPWAQVQGFGRDAVTVASADGIVEPSGDLKDLDHKSRDLLGRRVMTTEGHVLGAAEDVEFDPETGGVLTVLTTTQEVRGERILALGSWALVVEP